jgi:hypothetical protein
MAVAVARRVIVVVVLMVMVLRGRHIRTLSTPRAVHYFKP